MTFRELRINRCKNQGDFAKLIGVKQSTVSMWEKGKRKPPMTQIPAIANALGVTKQTVLDAFLDNDNGNHA